MNKQLISKNLEHLGTIYEKENLTKWKDNDLSKNTDKALDFFLDHSFARGRRDELSHEYHKFTIKILSEYYNLTDPYILYQALENDSKNNTFDTKQIKNLRQGKKNSIHNPGFDTLKEHNSLLKQLTELATIDIVLPYGKKSSKKSCLQNDADLLLVLDILNFMSESQEKINMYNYFNNLVHDNKIEQAYNELIDLEYIGDKIATFILRDIVIMNGYKLNDIQLKFIFPVDTWVGQIAELMSQGALASNKSEKIKEYFIQNFPNSNIPLIAAGLWYLGANSLKIAINCLGKH